VCINKKAHGAGTTTDLLCRHAARSDRREASPFEVAILALAWF
jgi:hypothetical protein